VYPDILAWDSVGDVTMRSYSACLREISQNTSRRKIANGTNSDFERQSTVFLVLTSFLNMFRLHREFEAIRHDAEKTNEAGKKSWAEINRDRREEKREIKYLTMENGGKCERYHLRIKTHIFAHIPLHCSHPS
jgi:hypothetical protein